MNKSIFILVFLLFEAYVVKGQALQFDSSKDTIKHRIILIMEPSLVEEIHDARGKKIKVKSSGLSLNGQGYRIEDIKLHGKTSLDFHRKSYTIEMKDRIPFEIEKGTSKLKDFYLISLSMDKNHIRNRLSYNMMTDQGMFDLSYGYVNLMINDRNEGIYLLIERPQDWAIKKKRSPYILRRDYGQQIERENFSSSVNQEEQDRLRSLYQQLYQIPLKSKGKSFYKKINKILKLDEYFTWLAFNYWFMNGDYTDELYLYIDPETGLFRSLPWDFDDIFSSLPHEGNVKRLRPANNDFMFSMEESFDQYLMNDDYMYKKYKESLNDFLMETTPEKLKKYFETVFKELYPYYRDYEIISQTKYDKYGETDLDGLEKEMMRQYEFIIKRRKNILEKLEP